MAPLLSGLSLPMKGCSRSARLGWLSVHRPPRPRRWHAALAPSLFSTPPTTLHRVCTIPAPCSPTAPGVGSLDGAAGLKTPAVAQSGKPRVSIAAETVCRPRGLGPRFRVWLLRVWTGTASSRIALRGLNSAAPPHPIMQSRFQEWCTPGPSDSNRREERRAATGAEPKGGTASLESPETRL
jgi:hypothetical protein